MFHLFVHVFFSFLFWVFFPWPTRVSMLLSLFFLLFGLGFLVFTVFVIIPCLSQYFYFLVFLVGFVLMFNFVEFF